MSAQDTPAAPGAPEDALICTELRVDSAPGMPVGAGVTLSDLGPGVNLVLGPNGSGKTTAARALMDLIWPPDARRDQQVRGRFRWRASDWSVRYEYGRRTVERDAAPAELAPPLGAELRQAAVVSLRGLMTDSGEAAARRIATEMRGGFDPAAAARAVGAELRPPAANLKEVRELRDAIQARESLERRHDELRERVAKRDAWAARLDEADAAVVRVRQWRDVRELHDLAAAHRDAVDAQAAARAAADAALADPDRAAADGQVLDKAAEQLRRSDERLAANAEARAAARRVFVAALARIDKRADPERFDAAAADLGDWDRLLGEAAQARAAASLADHARHTLGPAPRVEDREAHAAERDRLRDAHKALTDWLAASPVGADAPRPSRAWLAAGVAAAVVGGVAVALGWAPWGWLLVGTGVGATVTAWAVRAVRGGAAGGDDRGRMAAAYPASDVPRPDSWTPTAVRAALEAVAAAQTRNAEVAGRAALWSALALDVDAEDRAAAIDERLAAVRARLGAAPDAEALELASLADRLRGLQEAQVKLDALAGEHEALEAERARILDEAAAVAARHGAAGGSAFGPGELAAAAQGLTERLASYRVAAEQLAQATTAVVRAQAAFDAQQKRVDPAVAAEAEALDEAELERRIRAAQELAGERDDLLERIKEVDTEVRLATEGRDVEAALADEASARAALTAKRAEAGLRYVAAILAREIDEAGAADTRPDVLQRAAAHLLAFTHGRYRLDVRADAARLTVFDREIEQNQTIEQLSEGTRVQVLLAVRLAYLEHEEARAGVRLPLVFDEVIASSDDRRAEAVIGAVLEIAATGRQVLVLTAQADEAHKWRAAAGDSVPLREQSLGGRGHGAPLAFAPLAAAPAPVPPAAGTTLEDYARERDVALPALGLPARAAHAGVVLLALSGGESTAAADALHRLERAGLVSAGTVADVCARAPREAADLLGEAATPQDFLAALEALDAALAYARQGRGKPVDYGFLRDCDAVSDAFLERVWEAAAQVGYDAATLVDGLRDSLVKGFRKDKADDLDAALLDAGYIDPAPRLDALAIRERVAVDLVARASSGRLDANAIERAVGLVVAAVDATDESKEEER